MPTGCIHGSTPELTVLDLVDAPRLGIGVSNVASVIAELLDAEMGNSGALGEQSAQYPTVKQRIGRQLAGCGSFAG